MVFDVGRAIGAVDTTGADARIVADANPKSERLWTYGHHADVSPDGSTIVYGTCEFPVPYEGYGYPSAHELAMVNVDGTGLQRLTRDGRFTAYPAWSPDGSRIAFIRTLNDDPFESQIVILSANEAKRVLGTKGVGLYPPVWSPDGERMAFLVNEPAEGEKDLYIKRILFQIRPDGSDRSELGEVTTLPTWSPDGERLAFGLDDKVYTIRLDGTDRHVVVDHLRANQVSWSPDGTELLLASDGGVHVVRADGTSLRAVGPYDLRVKNAIWSPDGSMIAARHEYPQSDPRFVIFTMDQDGTAVRFLAQGRAGHLIYNMIDGEALKDFSVAVPPIDPATCSNGVAVAQPEVTPGLVEDCKVLLRLRNAFGPSATSSWRTVRNVAEWWGVFVSGDPLRVRELSLWPAKVMGTIPPGIAKLEMLEVLALHGNSLLVGPIPPELGTMSMLRYLRLGDNNLSGPIPPELGNLTTLMTLSLSHNNLSGPIPPELGNITILRTLGLSHNNLSGPIPPELGNLTSLRTLGLSHNNLSGPIPPELGNLTILLRGGTDLAHNNLSGCVTVELPRLWVEASGLKPCKP